MTRMNKSTSLTKIGVIALAAMFACGFAGPQEKPKTKKGKPLPQAQGQPKVEYKGSLPKNWDKINVSDSQKQKAYQILAKSSKDVKQLKKADDAAKEADAAQVKKLQADLKAAQTEAKAKVDALKKQIAEIEAEIKAHPLQAKIKEVQTQASKRTEEFNEKNKAMKEATDTALKALLKAEQRKKLEDLN